MAKSDEEKAAFMRSVGATHATWSPVDGIGEDGVRRETLVSLTLGPTPQSAPRAPGPAQRMADFHDRQKRQHDILFAASSVRPKLDPSAVPPTAVPRAVRAKEAAARRGEEAGNG
jgi:hypothetical protein